MKKLFYYLSVAALLLAFNACNDDDGPQTPPPSGGEEAVEEIVKALESKPEVSQFVEILKSTDVADLEESELTVFAVKNQATAMAGGSRADALDATTIKRHIAIGSYTKAELTDGMELKSIDGGTLYITRDADDVFVNGVVIEGEAIPAGNSYIYVVPEVIQAQAAPPVAYKHQTTINVIGIALGNAGPAPLAEVSILAKDGNTGAEIGTFQTNAEGQAVISHNCDTLSYEIEKAGYSLTHDGYLIAGLSADGSFMHVDINGDGVTDVRDKEFTYPFVLDYRNVIEEANSTQEYYMAEVSAADQLAQIEKEWEATMQNFSQENSSLDANLVSGSITYTSDTELAVYAERYWDMAYAALDKGMALQQQITSESEEAKALLNSISLDIAIIYVQLYGYYGQLLYMNADQLKQNLDEMENYLPAELSFEVTALKAKLALMTNNDSEANNYADKAISGIDHPTADIFLVKAIAAYKLNNIPEVLEALNQARKIENIGSQEIVSLEGNVLIETCHQTLIGTGMLYPCYRILDIDINYMRKVEDFNGAKHHLLPIPQSAMDKDPNLQQNPNYQF